MFLCVFVGICGVTTTAGVRAGRPGAITVMRKCAGKVSARRFLAGWTFPFWRIEALWAPADEDVVTGCLKIERGDSDPESGAADLVGAPAGFEFRTRTARRTSNSNSDCSLSITRSIMTGSEKGCDVAATPK